MFPFMECRKQKHIRNRRMNWAEAFAVPVGSIAICYVVWQNEWVAPRFVQMIVPGLLLLINLDVLYMYKKMQTYKNETVEINLLKQQNVYVKARYEEMEKQWLRLRRMRHNMANNCVLEMSYLEKKQYELLMEHYRERLGIIRKQEDVIQTGNIAIDSILNYKLCVAGEVQIVVNRIIEIADEVRISNLDLNVLIGNLFDNAMEAVRGLKPEKRKIDLCIKTDKTAFLLEIRNPYEGRRQKDREENFLTGKKDKIFHGLGLKEVKEIVKKYHGKFTVEEKEEEFRVGIFVYMD
ncbi:MAG: ATP-binding protein [Firmicutes bacterium]|nr:ATP-binding protein [Bacillota bacterium]